MRTQLTKVIFRVFPQGDVIALFPLLPWDRSGINCTSYQTIGQHGGASTLLTRTTRPATAKERRALAKELRRIGYRLQIVQRFPRNAYQVRKEAAK